MKTEANSIERLFSDGERDSYDAIVVGSGYGGSVAACRLAMAGVKVCLCEKGRRWEAQDFPTNCFQIMSTLRVEDSKTLGVSLGPEDALFQVYEQGDSLAAVACGLGGGSLVNAGVMIPTPVRARKNPKWPKDWETDWDSCEASASVMLGVQSVPVKFPNAKVMEDAIEEENKESSSRPVNLSVNFDIEGLPFDSVKRQTTGSCLACGNCLSGCPYNAKNSTDKNYAGCVVKTGCQVQYVVRNQDDFCDKLGMGNKRRWLVYFTETDHVSTDFVILSAGVFGTASILYQSQMRGLKLSESLGSGFSTNGNAVAYVSGSPAPLNSYALDRKQLFKVPFQERPGPSISSVYTSSLGYSIQGAVLPTSYPSLLFKGFTTYGWPTSFWLLHEVMDKLKNIIGVKSSQAVVLNAMGYDQSDGRITFNKDTNKISFSPPHDPLLSQKVQAFQKITRKLGGTLFMSRYRSTAVHLLGGCNASLDPSSGLCNPSGRVFDLVSSNSVHPGLYVCDASLVPCSVGINPALTIASVAEHVSRHLVQEVHQFKSKKPTLYEHKIAESYPESAMDRNSDSDHINTVLIKETLSGYVGGMPCTAHLKMNMDSGGRKKRDGIRWITGDPDPLLRGKVGGFVEFKALEMDNLHVIDGEVDLCLVNERTPFTQYMHYKLLLAASSGSRYILEGRKTMNPGFLGLYILSESTTLQVTFRKVSDNSKPGEMVNLRGRLNISMAEILKSLISLEGNLKGQFLSLFLQSLLRTYVLQIPRSSCKDSLAFNFCQKPYPDGSLHEIVTEDGFTISCWQWKCHQTTGRPEIQKQLYPVLLLNGYFAESYWLPMEPNDLVRTLLGEGHDTWVLQPRSHPSNPSNSFTIEDIGKYDIPAAIEKIRKFHGPSTKVHVVAHCAGGMAIHIALMGGFVPAAHIASLSCTNTAMFFKVTALTRVKMWLPLLPISMLILGKDKTLPLYEKSDSSYRHRLLRSIARFVPRNERCTCSECEVVSGIFGNIFWHENISPSMHHRINKDKDNLPVLPMAAFPHLRKICNTGYIVDSNGKNSYLIHPERMALPTLYISGGRTLLVMPETSFLANNFMKLHQPGFRHERVIVDGFGHSDLLIGEEAYKKVFPHILDHIRLAEGEGTGSRIKDTRKNYKDHLLWGNDPYDEDIGGFEKWVPPLVTLLLVFLFFAMLVSLVL
ncbi:Glucose-methanol-choline oxidoreductase, N-terminal [Dillenia turbinata]|uniref:Cholesterol oxidase n=1 Tax=Dillenia turbinata TaxID=194707 RepID=A0AAN8W145_9MAGN